MDNDGPRKKAFSCWQEREVPRTFGQKAASDVLATMMTGTMKTLLMFVQAYPPCVLSILALVYGHLQRDGREDQVLLSELDQPRFPNGASLFQSVERWFTVSRRHVCPGTLNISPCQECLQEHVGTLCTNRSLLPFKGKAREDACSHSPKHRE